MSKLIIILMLTLAAMQLAFCSSPTTTAALSDQELASFNSKRHNLIKRTFADLRKAIWQDVTFDLATEFMQNLKHWSNTVNNENFKKTEFQTQTDLCLNLLNSLKADRGNCEIHTNLVENYIQLRDLAQSVDSEFKSIKNGFTSKFERIIKKQRDELYANLKDEMEIFIKDLNETEKPHARDLIEWNDKFNSEKDFYVKQHMALDFPRLFTKDQLDANTTCVPQSITDTIN